jgi:hypothetical protein
VLATALPEAVVALTELATALPAGRVATAALLAAVVAAGAAVLAALPAVVLAAELAGRVAAAALAAAVVGAAAAVAGAAAVVGAAGFGVSVALLPPHAARIALPAAAPASIRNPRRGSRCSGTIVRPIDVFLLLLIYLTARNHPQHAAQHTDAVVRA